MTADEPSGRREPRHERTTRRAFFLWMTAYVAALAIVVAAHGLGGVATGTTIDANDIRTQQAKAAGQPQSSIAGRAIPQFVSLGVDG